MKPWPASTPGFDPPPSSGVIDITDEDDTGGFTGAKRKRSSNIVASDDETSYDDNASICTLVSKDYEDKDDDDVSSRPLKRLRKVDDVTVDRNKSGNSSCEDEDEDEDEDDDDDDDDDSSEFESESESGSGEADSYDDLEPENALNEDDMLRFTTPKRKRCSNIITSDVEDDSNDFKRNPSSNIVTSDDETSYDDNAPICTLTNKDQLSRRPLKRLKKSDDNTIDLLKTGNSSSEDAEDDDDDESLDGFIVKSSESESRSGSGSGGMDSCDDSEDGSDGYKVTLDKGRRKKELKLKWELEGDMLADFGKDPELCMKAVCALYRQQTEDEKAGKETRYHNARGFSHVDAFRGSKVAEFLTDGDPNGDLNKTVEELKEYDKKGVKLCMTLAAKYSKQLFQIYQNEEDPYFLP